MPAKSSKQQKFMAACAHGASKSDKCPPKSVAKEFSHKPAGGYSKAKGGKKK
jgi:hypothetical protein